MDLSKPIPLSFVMFTASATQPGGMSYIDSLRVGDDYPGLTLTLHPALGLVEEVYRGRVRLHPVSNLRTMFVAESAESAESASAPVAAQPRETPGQRRKRLAEEARAQRERGEHPGSIVAPEPEEVA